jgi:hypothetical protein
MLVEKAVDVEPTMIVHIMPNNNNNNNNNNV